MADRDQRQEDRADSWASPSGHEHATDFERTSTRGRRATACLMWAVAIAAQVLAVAVASGKIATPLPASMGWLVVVVAALACAALAVAGARSWMGARREDGDRGTDGFGVAMSCLAFAPMALFFATSRNATGRTKAVAVVCAVAMVAILAVEWIL